MIVLILSCFFRRHLSFFLQKNKNIMCTQVNLVEQYQETNAHLDISVWYNDVVVSCKRKLKIFPRKLSLKRNRKMNQLRSPFHVLRVLDFSDVLQKHYLSTSSRARGQNYLNETIARHTSQRGPNIILTNHLRKHFFLMIFSLTSEGSVILKLPDHQIPC